MFNLLHLKAEEHEFACVQGQKTLMGRGILSETTLEIFNTKMLSLE
jgi:molybdopterin-containing oxidoreductase family iron-sulfur binding subunit